MKKIFTSIFAGVLMSVFCAACDKNGETNLSDYYWVGDEKIPLQKIDGKYFVMFSSTDEEIFRNELSRVGVELIDVEDGTGLYAEVSSTPYKTATIEADYKKVKTALSHTFYWAPYYKQRDGREAWSECIFSVKLKSETDYPLLEKMAKENLVEIIGKNEFIGVYNLACNNYSRGKAVELGNFFHETGFFEYACASLFGIGSIYI